MMIHDTPEFRTLPGPRMDGSLVIKRNLERRTKVKTGCKTCRSVISDESRRRFIHHVLCLMEVPCNDHTETAIELGKSNATRPSQFVKNVSTLGGLATATSHHLGLFLVSLR